MHLMPAPAPPLQASDVLAQMLDPASKAGAALRLARGDEPLPSLPQLFYAGQFVRCEVIALGPGQVRFVALHHGMMMRWAACTNLLSKCDVLSVC